MTVRTKGILTHYLDAKAWGWKPRLARDYAISLYAKRNNLKHAEAQALFENVLKNKEQTHHVQQQTTTVQNTTQ